MVGVTLRLLLMLLCCEEASFLCWGLVEARSAAAPWAPLGDLIQGPVQLPRRRRSRAPLGELIPDANGNAIPGSARRTDPGSCWQETYVRCDSAPVTSSIMLLLT